MRKITKAGVRRRLSAAKRVARQQIHDVQAVWTERGPRAPVDFDAWIKRGGGRKNAAFPDVWRSRTDWPFEAPSRVAAVVHVFYPELVHQIVEQLSAIPVGFDLIVTNASGSPVVLDRAALPMARNVVVLDVENHGRDIWPLVQVVNAGLLDPYEIVLKVHTKRSEWREGHGDLGGDGAQWRDELIAGLLGSTENVVAILSAFAQNPDLGVVVGEGSLLGPEFWGSDLSLTQELLLRLELAVDPASLVFPAGSFYWVRAFVLQGLRALNLSAVDFEPEAAQIDGTTAHAVERSIGILAAEAGLKQITTAAIAAEAPRPEFWSRYAPDAPRSPRVTMVPFYLPQFHPFAENSRWWGEGFTEWTNVTAAEPVYRGHYQPRLPADLGFYDLRLDEVREHQAQLAAAHGVRGFMYYYYWFAGRRLMSVPIERLLEQDVDFPFCVMWANENWTRRWDGRVDDVLIGQDYEAAPAEQFIDDVMPFLLDDRYLRVDGKAVISVYRIAQIPDYESVIATWRQRARDAGVGEVMLLSVDVAREFDGLGDDVLDAGMDGLLGFPPHNTTWSGVDPVGMDIDKRFLGNILRYGSVVEEAERRLSLLKAHEFPGVMVAFDNTARRQWKSDIWHGSNPYTFRRWLSAAAASVADRDESSRVVFINAWNEWAEGAVLEPTDRHGRSYLHAVRDVAHG
jgi:lipopolysaccharide biosynthesis protein